MEKEFFDKILDQVIEEASTIYAENERNKKVEIDNSEFSDIHKHKMEKLFKEAKRNDYRKEAVKLTKKIAVVILCTLLITAGLITTVEAWREQVVKFIMKNHDDNYMSIKFGDMTDEESGEITNESGESNEFIIDDIKFMYIPDGFEFEKKEMLGNVVFYGFGKR